MHIYIYAGFMSDSCRIQLIPGLAIHPHCTMSFSCRFHAYLHLRRLHVRFMQDSVEFSLLVSCTSSPVSRISKSNPACSTISFFKTLDQGDAARSHFWWECLNGVCKWALGKVVFKCVVTPRAPENKSGGLQLEDLMLYMNMKQKIVRLNRQPHNTSAEHNQSFSDSEK